MNTILDIFLVTYDKLYDRAICKLDENELKTISCYCVQKNVSKDITSLITKRINEWELPWNNYELQSKQYYEYSTMVHLYNNQHIIQNTTHVGLFHYDISFNENSINDVIAEINKTPETIFYQKMRTNEQLSLYKHQVDGFCKMLSQGTGINVDSDKVWNNGWISECLSIVPKQALLTFAKFLNVYRGNIEYILKNNVWGIMDICPHRLCGIVERLWGFYLVSLNMPLKQLNVVHDWNSYNHEHMKMNGTGVATL